MTIKKVTYTDAGFVKAGRTPGRRRDADIRPGTYIDWPGLATTLEGWMAEAER